MFDSLQAAKFDPDFWKGLSVVDALRLDYKRFSVTGTTQTNKSVVFGASAVLLPMKDFFSKSANTDNKDGEDVMKGIASYMTEHASIDFLAILFFFQCPERGENRRQLMFCERIPRNDTGNVEIIPGLVDFLIDDGTLALKEIRYDSHDSVCTVGGSQRFAVRLFDQTNTKASRKQVAPLLMKFFETQ